MQLFQSINEPSTKRITASYYIEITVCCTAVHLEKNKFVCHDEAHIYKVTWVCHSVIIAELYCLHAYCILEISKNSFNFNANDSPVSAESQIKEVIFLKNECLDNKKKRYVLFSLKGYVITKERSPTFERFLEHISRLRVNWCRNAQHLCTTYAHGCCLRSSNLSQVVYAYAVWDDNEKD